MKSKIDRFFEINGIKTREVDTEKIEKYIKLLKTWNSKFSISSITDRDEIIEKHFLDSFALDLVLSDERVVDIGSGGGFPGLAYKLLNNKIDLTSIERNKKKISFQQRVASELGFKDIKFFDESLEKFSNKALAQVYVMRAVEKRELIFSWFRDNLGDAKVIYMSSDKFPEAALEKDFKVIDVFDYILPECNQKRRLICFKSK